MEEFYLETIPVVSRAVYEFVPRTMQIPSFVLHGLRFRWNYEK